MYEAPEPFAAAHTDASFYRRGNKTVKGTTMPLIGARMQSNEIEQLDQIAAAAQVPRAVIIRWALRDYVQRLLLSPRPVQETLQWASARMPLPDVAAYAQPTESHLSLPQAEGVEDRGHTMVSDGAFAQQVFGTGARAYASELAAAAQANHEGANSDDAV